jgi:hypothetical protein
VGRGSRTSPAFGPLFLDRLQAPGSGVSGTRRLWWKAGSSVREGSRMRPARANSDRRPSTARGPPSKGTIRATGVPRSVITTSSPARTRERNSLRRALIPPIGA